MNNKNHKVPQTPDELADAIFGKDKEAGQMQKKTQKATLTGSKSYLKLVSEKKTYKGEFGVYEICDGELTITTESKVGIDKVTLSKLIDELGELGGLMQ